MKNKPIGVFDSGLGGLTVVRELRHALPQEEIIYFGDTGRVPYGIKSKSTIERYAAEDIAFLQRFGVKLIIAACGTVSSVADAVTGKLTESYTGIVTPSAAAAVKASKTGKIGVIGTNATVASKSYEILIKSLRPDAEVYAEPCPLFVNLVESGWIGSDDIVTVETARRYLAPLKAQHVDTLILGCTHFPILSDIIQTIMGDGVTLIDSGLETAQYAKQMLAEQDLLADRDTTAETQFYVSDNVHNFSATAEILLGTPVAQDVRLVRL